MKMGEKQVNKKSRCRLTKTAILIVIIIMTGSFFLVELVVGQLTHSNALVADSFHMLSDLIALIIGLIAVRFSKKGSSERNTFGWARAEILGSLVNSVFLLALCFTIIVEAINRFAKPEPLQQIDLMLSVGAGGLLLNIISLVLFGLQSICNKNNTNGNIKELSNNRENLEANIQKLNSGITNANKPIEKEISTTTKKKKKSSNLNMQAVFMNALGDSLGSVAVIISGCLAKFAPPSGDPTAKWKQYIDPTLSLIIATIIISGVIPLLKRSAMVLLQTVPNGISSSTLKDAIKQINGIDDVHHFHIWSLNSDKLVASAHIRVKDNDDSNEDWRIVKDVKNLLHKNQIHSTTIQLEHDNVSLDSCNSATCDCKDSKCCNHAFDLSLESNIRQANETPNEIQMV